MGNSVLLQTVCGISPSEIRRVSTLLSSAHLGLLYFAKRGSKVDNSDLEHRRMARLSADQRCFNFTSFDDAAIENSFAVAPAIVHAIQTHDGSPQVQPHRAGEARESRQRFAQQRRFIAIARGRHERRDHVAIPIAQGNDLAALDLLVAAEAEVIASLLRCARGAIAMDDARVQTRVPMKSEDRALENGIQASVRFPPPEGAIDARVVNFTAPMAILIDGQFLPLTAQIKQPQDVVEDRMRAQLARRPATALAQMRPDK